MQFHKIIKQRKSVREFKEGNLENKDIDALMEFADSVKSIEGDISTTFYFVKDGNKAYEKMVGYAGYYGMPIEGPHYLLLMSEKKNNYKINAGYMMEQVMVKAMEMEIGTCWIDILEEKRVDLKSALKIDIEGEIAAIVALGYPKTNIFGIEIPLTGRKSIEEFVYKKSWGELMSLGELSQRGLQDVFYYVRYAPSWGNIQPWKFIIDDYRLILTMHQEKEDKVLEDHDLECGIMMLYIEKMMHSQGISGKWTLNIGDIDSEEYKIPESYKVMGWFPI
ncbi:MAG TPA: hypothetical protein GXZ78_02765 [Eubacteriaceae bacterium]|nr:hypothetical protein [Eubacteriaceae bacterium]